MGNWGGGGEANLLKKIYNSDWERENLKSGVGFFFWSGPNDFFSGVVD